MNSGRYWSEVADRGDGHIAYPMWRTYCDALHTRLIRNWTVGAEFGHALKTDLFDEACGGGLVSTLGGVSGRVMGVDVSPSVAERAGARHPGIDTRIADVRQLPFEDGGFNFVLSNSTLDHFEDPRDLEKSVREIVRVLAPGGTLLLTLDNPLNPVIALRNRMPASFFGRTALAPYLVGHTLSLSPMARLLESCGCEVRRKSYIMHVPRIILLHLCRWLAPDAPSGRAFLRFMLGFEVFAPLPTAPLTGHFAAALAVKKA